jgi:hypothetical protein
MRPSLTIKTLDQLRLFMEHHVFAVWDFMLLLKSLQQQIVPSGTPWLPPKHPGIAGLVNALVAEEECDCLPAELGGPIHLSHFSIYRRAMQEIGADTRAIDAVLSTAQRNGLHHALLHPLIPAPSKVFIRSTLDIIESGQAHLTAAAFCYGRECLVPDLFKQLLAQISQNSLHAPTLIWYLERHITLDGDSHGPLAERMVQELCENDPRLIQEVDDVKSRVVVQRNTFWRSIAQALDALSALPAYC